MTHSILGVKMWGLELTLHSSLPSVCQSYKDDFEGRPGGGRSGEGGEYGGSLQGGSLDDFGGSGGGGRQDKGFDDFSKPSIPEV